MKNVWYLIKNIALAVGITVIGSYMASGINSAILWIMGIYLIFAGMSHFGETNPWVSIVIMGIGAGAIALGKTVLKDNEISYYISAGFIALIALRQLLKIFESYGAKKWQKILMKLLTLAYPAFIIAGSVFAIFFHDVTKAASFFSLGSVMWIIHSVLVVCLKVIPTYGKKSGSRPSKSGGNGGQSKVANEMRSVATYFTGGFDNLSYGATIKYSVSVDVSGENIDFTLSGTLSGTGGITTQAQAESVKGSLQSAVARRQKLILDRACSELEKLNPEGDYSVNVEIGNFS